MQAEHFRPQDLFAQIQGLVDGLTVERSARDAAEAAHKAKTELLAMVGHELRAPMESVISMIDLLKASPLDPAQQRYTDMIVQATQSLVHVLDDVLEYARLEAGGFELDSAPFDLHELLHDVGFELQARASQKGLTNSLDIGASCPRAVAGDAARLRQVLLSLIDNALKFTAEGSVRLHASGIDVDGLWRLRFDVSDTGSGHSRAERELLFKPALHVPSATVRQNGGTGLELAMARQLAELMGGEVGCNSVVGKGSLYWFTLAAAHKAAAPQVRSDSEPEPLAKLSGRVLVVEDNAVNRMLIADYLEEFGLSHEMVASASTALLSLASKHYDLVLMDAMMPDLDGIETTKRIRGLHAPASEVPIVALVSTKNGDRGTYLSAGMDAYVAKPIRGRELYRVLAPFLAGKAGDKPASLAARAAG